MITRQLRGRRKVFFVEGPVYAKAERKREPEYMESHKVGPGRKKERVVLKKE